jgi:HD superfamily phosphohydrolase
MPRTHVRDPLNGDVRIRDEERPVLDAAPVQRLRYVGQIGYAQVVWPGATHTRFVHSVGVLETATRIAEAVDLPDHEVTNVRLAALLHDVGHGPFSHVSDHIPNADDPVHEERSCAAVDDLADLFPAAADPDRVKAYIRGEAPLDIVAGTIDADRLDYLRRDAANTGIGGSVDVDTVTKFVGRRDGTLYFERPATRGIEALLTARYRLLEDVHQNKTSAIARTMLRRALERYFEAHPDASILDHDDRTMHAALLDADGPARYYYRRLVDRRLFKRVLHLPMDWFERDRVRDLADRLDARALETEIAEAADLDARRVLVDPPVTPDRDAFDARISVDGRLRPIDEVSRFPDTLAESEWQTVDLGVYAPESVGSAVATAARRVLDGHLGVDVGDRAPRTRA